MRKHSIYPNKAGIYKLLCNSNGKIYIGKTVNLVKRLNSHKNCKLKLTGMCYFQYAILKYGWDSFTVEILEVFENFDKLKDNDSLLEREAYYIKLFDSTDKNIGYNTCSYSTDGTGISRGPRSEETKEKIRKAHLGKKLTCEHKEKMRQNNLGKKHSEETKEKIRLGNLGKILPESAKEKVRLAQLGRKHSEESKEKMRNIKLGKKHSEETKEKMKVSHLKKQKNV